MRVEHEVASSLRSSFPGPHIAGERRFRRLACAILIGLAGCSGNLGRDEGPGAFVPPADGSQGPNAGPNNGPGAGPGEGDPTSQDSPGANCDTTADTGSAPLRRLSRLEYALTLQQLFQLNAPPDVQAVPAEAERAGFTVYAALQTLSAQHLRAYLDQATSLADALLSDAPRRMAIIGCGAGDGSCLDAFVERFGRLVFRRPLSAEEREGIAAAARGNALDEDDRYRYAIEALLISPHFLYRAEFGQMDGQMGGDSEGASPARLSDYELSTRLSFTLLGHGPSEALLDMAARGELGTPAGRAAAAATLTGDAGFEAFYLTFFEQWLGFDDLVTPKEPPADWDPSLLDDMRAETIGVIERFAWGGEWGGESFLDALTTSQTRVTPALARFYGLPEPGPEGWLEIPADHPRAGAGLLTHASLLSQKTDGDRVAMRGNWLRRTFLCRNLQIPEAIAAQFGERLVGLTHTEIVRERNSDDSCRGCHAAIDPIGVGLDRFDATGRFDASYVVPDYGVTPGLPDAPEPAFDDVAELAEKLQALPAVTTCLTERTFLFVHGREPEARDRCTIESAQTAFVSSGYDYRELVQGLLDAPAFALRRVPEAPAEGAPSSPEGAAP